MFNEWSSGVGAQPQSWIDVGFWSRGGERTAKQLDGGRRVFDRGRRTAKQLDVGLQVVEGGALSNNWMEVDGWSKSGRGGCGRTAKQLDLGHRAVDE